MKCTACNSDLVIDDEIDTASIDSDCVIENFKCSDEECGKHFEIEFHPINLLEI